jgi:hypothetical protein
MLWYFGLTLDLGDLNPSGDSRSAASAINDSGYIVGSAQASGAKGVLWENGQIYKLNDLIDPSDPKYGTSFSVLSANDINQNGWIVGTAYYPGDRAVLLRPTQPIVSPYPDGDVAPLGLPDGKVNVADVLVAARITLGSLAAGTLELLHGDMNRDGVLNLYDLFAISKLAIN